MDSQLAKSFHRLGIIDPMLNLDSYSPSARPDVNDPRSVLKQKHVATPCPLRAQSLFHESLMPPLGPQSAPKTIDLIDPIDLKHRI